MKQALLLPNVGKVLSERLQDSGINTVEEMKTLGAEGVFLKLKARHPDSCISSLYAIEGALQGIRWHNLAPQRKCELNDFYKKISATQK